jgi:hypothetical protein
LISEVPLPRATCGRAVSRVAGRVPSGASARPALVGGGAADLFDEKRVNAAVRIVAGHAGKAGIHDHCHSINREGGFSHVSRNDDLAFSDSRDSLVLVRGWEFAVKRKDKTSAWRAIAHFTDGALDLVRTGHENENISIGAVKILRNRVCGKFPWGSSRGSWRRYRFQQETCGLLTRVPGRG